MTREEAIKKIKEAMPTLWKETKEVIQVLIPEFAENEDEKIRKEMIRYFTEMKKGGSVALPYDDCIAYLERQKEQKPADEAEKFFDSVESYNQGFVAGQKKMKEDIEKGFGISEHSLDYLAGRYAGYAAARQEQKPAEWSEEDERKYQCIRNILLTDMDKKVGSWKYSEILEWYEKRGISRYTNSKLHWKPNEEQMEALKNSAYGTYQNGDGPILRGLYEQLEKL